MNAPKELEAALKALSGSVGGLNAAPPADPWKPIELVDYYGCVACQKCHHRGGEFFEEHIMRQDKRGIRKWPASCFPASPVCAAEKNDEKG